MNSVFPTPAPSSAAAATAPGPKSWSVGTLTYNRRQLVWLFFWILLADFTLTLMESVMPSLLPLSLKEIGASNTIIGLTVTISSAMNMVLNPVISTASDRHRGPRGRRLPFLLWPTPFVALFLVLTGFSPQIGAWLHRQLPAGWGLSAYAVTLTVMFTCMVLFQACNLFVNCVYWYIFADLVPHALMGRFLALLRIIGQFASFVWGAYIFGLADRYMPWIYLGGGVVYATSFLLFCWRVREGEYPPPPPRAGHGPGWMAWVQDYFQSCVNAPLWRWIILAVVAFQVAQISNLYWVFFGRDTLGCSLDVIGKIAGWGSLISIPLVIVLGWLVDRLGPARMVLAGAVFSCAVAAASFFSIHGASSLIACGILAVVGVVWVQAAMMPMYIQFFPAARYGQFCSAVNMLGMLAVMLFSVLLGALIDWLGDYRWLLVWRAAGWAVMIPAVARACVLYRRHGGPAHYVPPTGPA